MIFNTPHGEYVLVRKIATSGMADVFLAKSPGDHLEKFVALKCLHSHLADDRRVLRLFYEEARLGSLFRSPNLITVHDARLMAGRHTIVMDFAAGTTSENLRGRSADRNQPLTVAETLEVCRQAAAGLHDAHQTVDGDGETLGVIHRDVSPDNILLGFDGKVRVLDFGVAETSRIATGATSGAGKSPYMPPEVLRGEEYDHRVDVYSLGVVMYELLCGRSPYRRDSPAQTLQAVVAGVCPPPLPEEWASVNRLVMRAMAPDVEDRFANAHHLRLAIEEQVATIGDSVQLSDRIKTLFEEERRELQQQIFKIERAPVPSPSTVDLSHSPGQDLATVNPSQFEVGEDGINTSILRLDAQQVEAATPRPSRQAVGETPGAQARSRWSRALLVASILAFAVLGALFVTSALKVFPFAEAETQLVRVESVPPGATLRLDGEPDEMMTPSQVAFDPNGSETLQVSLPGYRSVELALSADTPPELEVLLDIDPTSPDAPIGSVRVTFAPVNARLKVDGEIREGLSPVFVEHLAIGREHSLSLELDGFESLYVPFELNSTETLELDLRLSEGGPLGQLTISSRPTGADVEINGQSIGSTPVEGVELPANQTYTISLSKPGYHRWRRGIYLREQEELEDVRLEPIVAEPVEESASPQEDEDSPPSSRGDGQARYPYQLIRD